MAKQKDDGSCADCGAHHGMEKRLDEGDKTMEAHGKKLDRLIFLMLVTSLSSCGALIVMMINLVLALSKGG